MNRTVNKFLKIKITFYLLHIQKFQIFIKIKILKS